MAGNIDLHTHTMYSDGGLTPNQLVVKAKEVGLKAIALTDHDNIAATEVAMLKGKELGVEVIPAIELTAYLDENSDVNDLHILGYFIDPRDRELRKKLEFYQKEREDKSRKVVKNLNALGYKLEFNEVKKLAKGTIAGPHIAFLIISKKDNEALLTKEFGKIPETGEFIQKYLVIGGPAYEARVAATPKEAIDLIHQAGGLAILAHPCWNLAEKDGKKLIFNDKVISDLVSLGLDGIEVYAHRENEADTKKCVEHFEKVAAKLKLVVSGGSDFHDFGSAGKDLGFEGFYLKVPYSVLENLKKRLKVS